MLAEVRKRITCPGGTLDDVCNSVLRGAAAAKKVKSVGSSAERAPGRHVRWTRATEYECIQAGQRDFASAAELDACWNAGEIALSDMYVMRHREAGVLTKRSQLNPLWEALYYLSDVKQFVRAQKCHLRWAYERAGRTDKGRAWSVCAEDGLPYWVDRHAFSVLKIK